MKLENEFTVPASIDEAWNVLMDIPRVAPCLPGATVEAGGEDGTYNGTMKVKIGPISASYKGTVKIEEADESARRVAMRAQAKDARGQGTAAATITSTMEETSDGTKVHVETDMRITGAAAQFGRGVMQDVSAKMMKRFADCLAQEIGGGREAAAEEEPVMAAPEPPSGDGAGGEVPSASSGVSSAEAAPPPSASSGVSSATPPPPRPTDDVLDIAEVSREAVLKRALPVVGVAIALLVLFRLIRR
jgi:carbon monoxide dehydrogenase subunit G